MKSFKLIATVAFSTLFAAGLAMAAAEAPAAKVANCCAKAAKDHKACDHPCCVEAAKAGKNCTKCGGSGDVAKPADAGKAKPAH